MVLEANDELFLIKYRAEDYEHLDDGGQESG